MSGAEFWLSALANVLGTVVGGVIAFFLVERLLVRRFEAWDRTREQARQQAEQMAAAEQLEIAEVVDDIKTPEEASAVAEGIREWATDLRKRSSTPATLQWRSAFEPVPLSPYPAGSHTPRADSVQAHIPHAYASQTYLPPWVQAGTTPFVPPPLTAPPPWEPAPGVLRKPKRSSAVVYESFVGEAPSPLSRRALVWLVPEGRRVPWTSPLDLRDVTLFPTKLRRDLDAARQAEAAEEAAAAEASEAETGEPARKDEDPPALVDGEPPTTTT